MAHGVTIQEVPTGVRPPVRLQRPAVYVGTAPISSVDLTNVNKIKLAFTLAEAVAVCGPQTDDFDSWTLHEAIKAHFSVYGAGPIVLINVIDPENPDHVASASGESHQLVDGEVQLQVYGGPDEALLGVLKDSVVVTGSVLDVDYTLAFDDDGFLVVSIVEGGNLDEDEVILVDFDYLDPSGVTADDIIGGYSGGAYTGLEVVQQVPMALRLVPAFINSPKWSQVPEVAARMAAIARSVSGTFRCVALVDLPTDPGTIATYAEAPAYKSDNGFDSIDHITCWPKFKNGSDTYHLSTHAACVAQLNDKEHGDLPFSSPSNKNLTGTAAVDDDGNEILLTPPQANFLNDQGIVTALNGFASWKLWGNRTGGYPATTDPKDAFIPIRRMGNELQNVLILTVAKDVDEPGNRRLIGGVVGTVNLLINSWISQGAMLPGSKVSFLAEDNPTAELLDGHYTFRVTQAVPPPAENIEFTIEYDASLLAGLFA